MKGEQVFANDNGVYPSQLFLTKICGDSVLYAIILTLSREHSTKCNLITASDSNPGLWGFLCPRDVTKINNIKSHTNYLLPHTLFIMVEEGVNKCSEIRIMNNMRIDGIARSLHPSSSEITVKMAISMIRLQSLSLAVVPWFIVFSECGFTLRETALCPLIYLATLEEDTGEYGLLGG